MSSSIFQIKVIPGAKRSDIIGWENGWLKIRIAAQPEKGKANSELVRFLSKFLKIPKRDILVVSGLSNRQKRVSIEGFTHDELMEKLR